MSDWEIVLSGLEFQPGRGLPFGVEYSFITLGIDMIKTNADDIFLHLKALFEIKQQLQNFKR